MRNNAGVHETIKRFHIVRVPLRVDSSAGTCFEVEYRGPDVWVFANTHLSFAVKIPNWFCQNFCDIRTFFLQSVPDKVGGLERVSMIYFGKQNSQERVVCWEVRIKKETLTTMSDSPPSRALATQSRPTMSESSAWKNCLHVMSTSSGEGEHCRGHLTEH